MKFLAKVKFIILFNISVATHIVAISEDDNLTESDKNHARNHAQKYFDSAFSYSDGYIKRADYTIADHEYSSFKACQLNTLLKIIDTCHFMHSTAGGNLYRHDSTPKHIVRYIDETFQILHHEFYKLFMDKYYINTYNQKIPLFTWNDIRFWPLLMLGKIKHDTLALEEANRTEFLFKSLEQYLMDIYMKY